MTSILSMVYSFYVVVICDSIMFLVMSNGNMNMSPVSENDMFISVLYIGDAFHAYIANNIPILHCYFVETSVSCSLWIFFNLYIFSYNMVLWILLPLYHLCGFLDCYGVIESFWGFNGMFNFYRWNLTPF